VIGSRGLSRFKSFWQDSVSSNVVRLAQVPVIVVK
jgi:nucleotide-binding universal stress UspA family protein